jgi:hypothetical protein
MFFVSQRSVSSTGKTLKISNRLSNFLSRNNLFVKRETPIIHAKQHNIANVDIFNVFPVEETDLCETKNINNIELKSDKIFDDEKKQESMAFLDT